MNGPESAFHEAPASEESVVSAVGTESFLQLLVDNSASGLLAIDASSTIVFANPALGELFGYDPDDLVGESLTILMPERLEDRHLEAIDRYLETGERTLDWSEVTLPGRHRDGHELALELSFREVDRNGHRLFVGIVTDVSERERAALERRLMYSVSRAVAEAGTAAEGLQSAIRQVCNLTDWVYGEAWVPGEDGDVLERTPSPQATRDGVEPFDETGDGTTYGPGDGLPGRVWETGESVWVPDVASDADGACDRTEAAAEVGFHAALGVPIVDEGDVVAVLAFFADDPRPADGHLRQTLEVIGRELGQLVARRRAEARLDREREVLERVQEASPVGIYTVTPDGETARMNDRAQVLLGVSRDDLEGRPFLSDAIECLDGDGTPVPPADHPVTRVIASGDAVRDVEHRVELGDGTRRWLSTNAVPIHDSAGDLDRVVVTVADVTETKEYEAALEHERAELRTELDELLGRISDGMFALDDGWRVTFANDRAGDLLGRTGPDLEGEVIWNALDGTAETALRPEFERAMETQEATSFEVFYEPVEAWFELNVYPSETGLSVYFADVTRRKRHEQSLTALHAAAGEMLEATDEERVSDLVVETATDVLDANGAAVYLFDGDDGVLRPTACSDALRSALGAVPTVRPGDGIVGRSFIEDAVTRIDDVREAGSVSDPETTLRSQLVLPLGDRGVLLAASTEVDAFTDREQDVLELLAATTETALGRLERERNLRDREQELAKQNRRLTQLDRANGLIRNVHRVLIEATTRGEIDQMVCRELTAFDPIAFVWIADAGHDGGGDGDDLAPRAWAGAEQGYLDEVVGVDAATVGQGEPARRTADTDEVTVVESVAEGLRTARWRQLALVRGFQSAISVPLAYDEFSYGTLTVYTTEPGFVDDMTREVFEELGRGIANGINAVETKQGLLFDRVVQVELRLDDADDILHRLAGDVEGTVEFEGVIPGDETSLVYFTAAPADVDRVKSRADSQVAFERVRHLGNREGRALFEAVVDDSLVAAIVADLGGTPRSIRTDGTELRAIVDLPYRRDVRSFVERLRSHCPGAELVARRERERSVETGQGFRAELAERLTDRQLEVLRTAYHAGFYDDPRASTGEELGRALDITQPTVNAHLRAAQRRLLGLLFDDAPAVR